MNSNPLLEFVQTGFRVSLGAATSLVESLQDAQKRQENLALLRSDFSQQVAELAVKGEKTEQEARIFMEEMLKQHSNPGSPQATETPRDSSVASPSGVVSSTVQQELEELTRQIAAIRTELEQIRNAGSNN